MISGTSLKTGLLLAALCANSVYAGEGKEGDTSTMIIMAPKGPVMAELSITVDDEPYRLWVTRFLVRRIDLNGDSDLTTDEISLIPARLLQQIEIQNAEQALRKASGDSEAESISGEEFSGWFAGQLTNSFNLIAAAVQASEAVRLASYIDADGDGRVSADEVRIGAYTMRFRDLDDDETYSASELLPFRDPRTQQAAVVPDAANLPFVQLTDQDAIERTAEQILNRYGDGDSVPGLVLRKPDDSRESLNRDDVTAWLASRGHHLKIGVQLSERANSSRLELQIPESSRSFCRYESTRAGRANVWFDDMKLNLRSRGGSKSSRGFMVKMLMQRVSAHDQDKNGYISDDEFPELQQAMSTINVAGSFEDVDLNSDGMVLRQEVGNFIERDAIVSQSRIEVTVQQDGKTLFKLLDVNGDRRLTRREFNHGFDALKEYDFDGDQHVTESELGTTYSLLIGLGRAESMRMENRMMNPGMSRTDAVLPGLSGLEGPEWFRRMDRNQDRDVSLREFLGPRRIFDQLDTDQDGLLNAAEAEALDE